MSDQQDLHVDVMVIGWGKGGKTLAGALAGAGRRVAMIERSREMHGGTCINIGCVPTKALVHDSQQHGAAGDGERFAAAVTRRDALVEKLRAVNHAMLADRETVTIVEGEARFVGERVVEVTGGPERLRVSADTVLVDTGAEAVLPDLPGIDHPRVHDSTSIQHPGELPGRVVVLGAGPIGLEFASLLRGFGSEVTLLDRRERLLPAEDEDVAAAVTSVLEGDGVRILHRASATAIEDAGGLARVRVDVAGTEQVLEAEAVLVATGRRPATAALDPEAGGIALDGHGAIVVDEHLRTSVPGVWALGDVHGGAQQTYLSLDDHRVVLDQLLGDGERTTTDRVAVPATTFLTPPLASVGLTERAAREAGHEVRIGVAEVATIKAMPRPKAVGDPRGLVKIVVDAETDLVLGARLFHVDAQEVVNLVALAMRTGTTATQLRDGIWTHPSSTEALNEVLGALR